jgi:uncharacterized DUF497 family protein
MRWLWDDKKDAANRRKHGLGFELAQLVFDDPLALSRPDNAEADRWQTVGMIGQTVILVIHSWPDSLNGEETGRIISARKATPHERKAYEEGDF